MKKIGMIAALFLSTLGLVQGQIKKIGYINSSELLLLMPERKGAEESLQKEAGLLEQQLTTMSSEYQGKVQEFQSQQTTMSDLMKQTKAKEITDLEERIKSFQASAEEELRKKESALLEPILDKARKAIKEVADKNGYSHVFDSASGIVIHAPETDNILPLVKKHLNLQ